MNRISAEHDCCRDRQAMLKGLQAAMCLSYLWQCQDKRAAVRELLVPLSATGMTQARLSVADLSQNGVS
ncbi:MAG TPA: hypothetical protein VIH59_11750 [Candidatus Tectomicrobia bacterium]|jgi:hypothetical protein